MTELVQLCSNHDGIKAELDVEESFKAPNDVNSFLLYEDEKMVSFINLFAPKTTEAELSAFSHPEYRNQGFFRKLLTEAKAELISRGICDILFVCDRKSKDGQSVASHLKAVYDFSEYSMQYTSEYKISTLVPNLRIRAAVSEDTPRLVNLSRLSLAESAEDAENYIKHIFSSENRTQHVAIMDDKIAGMISTAVEGKKSYIHGLCVFPEYRKRGIGGALLDYKVGQSLMRHPDFMVELEVETQNEGALSIYKRAGFEVKACYDYFRKDVSDLIQSPV